MPGRRSGNSQRRPPAPWERRWESAYARTVRYRSRSSNQDHGSAWCFMGLTRRDVLGHSTSPVSKQFGDAGVDDFVERAVHAGSRTITCTSIRRVSCRRRSSPR
jgi:hypothetical protein